MSTENFFTIQAQSLPSQGKTSTKNGGSPALAPSKGLSFLDTILAQIEKTSNTTRRTSDDSLPSRGSLLDKDPGLHLAELIATNSKIKEELKEFMDATRLGPDTELSQALALNQQAFDNTLKPLTDTSLTSEEIANGTPRILQAFLIEVSEGDPDLAFNINNLKAMLESGEGTITNLTPQQLTALQNLPKDAELPEELAGNPFLMIIQLTPPQNQKPSGELSLKTGSNDSALQNLMTVLVAPAAQSHGKGPLQTESLSGRLNALAPGTDGEALFTIEDYEGQAHLLQNNTGKGKAAKGEHVETLLKNAQADGASPLQNLSFLQNGQLGVAGALLAPFEFTPGALDEYGLNTASSAPSTLGTVTSLVTQVHNAQGSHPAVQAVAVQMQKAAGNAENKTLTLQLDPPELGRVRIKMEFGSDKTLKAVLTAEKPETFMMMQRDVHTLERALQDAGLDIDNGLSFELAEHGFDFDQDNRRGGGHGHGGTGNGNNPAEAGDIIETTMTWHIDPETGHTRYDILA